MIPEGWKQTELGALADFASGGTPSKQNEAFWGGFFPWVSAKDLKKHVINNAELCLTEEGRKVAKTAPIGSVLVLVRGMTLLKDVPIGYVAEPVAFNQDIKALVAKSYVAPKFLAYLLVSLRRPLMTLVNTANHGTGRLDTDLLKSFPVVLPSFVEQCRIAKTLETWDRAIETVEALIANARAQKQALMQQLLPQGATPPKKRLPGFSGEWREMKLGGMAKVVMGSSPPSSAYNETEIGLPLIQGNADIKNRQSAPRVHTSEITQVCEPKDILFSVRAPVGEISIAIHHACIGRGIAAIRPHSGSDADFLYFCLLAAESRWARLSQGSTFQAVNSKDLRGSIVFAPSKETEREAIGAAVRESQSAKDNLQSQLAALRREKAALMQQLLTGKRRVKLPESEVA